MIFINLEWCLVALYGFRICSTVALRSPFLAVIDPNSFGLVQCTVCIQRTRKVKDLYDQVGLHCKD